MRAFAQLIVITVTFVLATAGTGELTLTARQRPPVMGRTAGVSAGHPLTTAAAVEILQKGGNAFDAGVAAMLVGGVVEQDLYGFGGEGLVLVYPRAGAQGDVGRRTGLGCQGRDHRLVYGTQQDPRRLRYRSGGRAGRTPRGADRARALGHDDLRAGRRACRSSTRGTGFRCVHAPLPRSNGSESSSSSGRRTSKTWLKPDGSLYQPGDTIKLPDLAATLHQDGRRGAVRPPPWPRRRPSPPRGIGSTRVTSRRRWSPSSASTVRRSTRATLPSSSRASRRPRRSRTAVTRSTSRASTARARHCCRR